MARFLPLLIPILMFVGVPWSAAADEPPMRLSLDDAVTNQLEVRPLGEAQWELRTTGGDPFIEIPLPEIATPSETPVLTFEYFSPQGVVGMEIRIAAEGDWSPPIDAEGLAPAEGWVPAGLPLSAPGNRLWDAGNARRLRIDFGIEAGVSLRIRNLGVRPRSAEELQSEEARELERSAKKLRAEQIVAYLEAEFPASISAVAVDATTVRISGQCPPGEAAVSLAELPWHADAVRPGQRHIVVRLDGEHCDQEGRFQIELPRDDSGRDRLGSRWQIVGPTAVAEIFEPLSHARYATELSGIGNSDLPPPPRLRNAKGLGGVSPAFGLDELVELGVRHVTVNVVLSGLLRELPPSQQSATGQPVAGQSGAEGRENFTHNGRTWGVNWRQLDHVDQTVAFAAEHDITVALILLLRTGADDILMHPEANRAGVYAMPNLDDPEAADKYEAVLALLAERYSGGPRGRVDHWIIHNEVDYGWTWTNMGHQPLEVYLASYVRSMRMTYLQARRFNPFATVFISLTHRWNVPRDEQWKTYPPRELLRRLAQFTAAEGGFGWGVGNHPYPESLWNSRTWEDTNVQDDFDTPLITMKNIGVIERFLELPEMRDAEGRVRPVLLSEQGYHTDGYGEKTQREQAAALLYTWDQLRTVKCVLAYDYHRWVDSAQEGGLLLGLRKVGSDGRPAGGKKLAWEVYRAIGTDEEAKWRERLEEVYK